ncbi:hypothetical protein HY285_05400 [Candidatus Peregrinibacteria bacterium]|nr:hypothetical protein [Candidatus Peregrinibacteria bacterium]MBI3816945.1 hypothetical protein [Candidatus Peregrinibacteria bacterium]
MGISLKRLEKKKLDLGINKLSDAGIDVERWLAMCDGDAAAMQRLVAAWPIRRPSYVYDAATVSRVLGLPCECSDPVPRAADGEVVVYYHGWELQALEGTGKVVNYLSSSTKQWKAPAGYYRALIPVPESNRLTWNEQAGDDKASLLARQYAGWLALPTPIGATALAVHLGVTGEDLLQGNFCRCAEALPGGSHAELDVGEGRVVVSGSWDGDPSGSVFLGAARKA